MSESVINIQSLSKRYYLGDSLPTPYCLLRRALRPAARVWRAATGALAQHRPMENRSAASAPDARVLWALRDIDLSVHRGEVLGIIGGNGAGKSTLLKILARITEPTEGRVTMRGRVASLLEVGTGFHPELSGRDNVYLNVSILGLSLHEIRRRFDSIVDFAGVERFLDTPVKRYSSGMYVRLAFAVAAHLEPEILIVDEVLAVGDVAFQRKCLGKMQTIADGGRTVLFVSHNLAAINHFCTRAICVKDGRIVDQGEPSAVVGHYLSENFLAQRQRVYPRDAARRVQIRRLELRGLPEGPGGVLHRTNPLEVCCAVQVHQPTSGAIVRLVLEKPDGTVVGETRDADCGESESATRGVGTYDARVQIPGGLLNSGTYTLRAAVEWSSGGEMLDHQDGLTFELHDPPGRWRRAGWAKPRAGALFLDLPWTFTPLECPGPLPGRPTPESAVRVLR